MCMRCKCVCLRIHRLHLSISDKLILPCIIRALARGASGVCWWFACTGSWCIWITPYTYCFWVWQEINVTTVLITRVTGVRCSSASVCLSVCTTEPERLKLQLPNLPQWYSIMSPGYPFSIRSGSQSAKNVYYYYYIEGNQAVSVRLYSYRVATGQCLVTY